LLKIFKEQQQCPFFLNEMPPHTKNQKKKKERKGYPEALELKASLNKQSKVASPYHLLSYNIKSRSIGTLLSRTKKFICINQMYAYNDMDFCICNVKEID